MSPVRLSRQGFLNGFTLPFLVAVGLSVAAVQQGVARENPWLLLAPAGFLGALNLYVLKKVVDVERRLAGMLPTLTTHGEEIAALRDWKHDEVSQDLTALKLDVAILREQAKGDA